MSLWFYDRNPKAKVKKYAVLVVQYLCNVKLATILIFNGTFSPLSSVAILTLSYVAQALVVVVVGLNLGFRYAMLSLHSTALKSCDRYPTFVLCLCIVVATAGKRTYESGRSYT